MGKKPATDSANRADEDALAFRAAVRDVKPLAHTASPAAIEPPRARRRRAPVVAEPAALAETLPLVVHDGSVAGSDALSFSRPGVRAQVMRRLRRGLYPIEDELDLHGLSQAQARLNLVEFIAVNRDAGRRSVRIIHGKGFRSGARGPVLKTAVNTWLKRHPDVLAFTSARTIDGGTGALYVLLRR